jgi:hypothetical protein
VESQKTVNCETLSFKERWVLMVAGELGRSAVPSSALNALSLLEKVGSDTKREI